MNDQMMRVISSPSSSTTGFLTSILAMWGPWGSSLGAAMLSGLLHCSWHGNDVTANLLADPHGRKSSAGARRGGRVHEQPPPRGGHTTRGRGMGERARF